MLEYSIDIGMHPSIALLNLGSRRPVRIPKNLIKSAVAWTQQNDGCVRVLVQVPLHLRLHVE